MKNLVKIPSQKILRVFKTLRIYTVLLPLVGGWGACSLFSDPEPTLPPATQHGAETFGCLVNGKVFVPKGGGNYGGLVKIYDGRLTIAGTKVNNNNDVSEQVAFTTSTTINSVGTFILNSKRSLFYASEYCGYGTGIPFNGKVVITKYERGEDKTNNLKWLIVAGTFEGILPPERNCKDTLHITEGRFDVKFN
jgi:hypothetical protein